MCGLWGAFRADDSNFVKITPFMEQGLYISSLRGLGGTGVGLVDSSFDTEIAKSYLPAPTFLGGEEWDYVSKNIYQSRVILGHTRSATVGNVNSKNAHPFRFVHEKPGADPAVVVSIHNGHVRNYHSLTPNTFNHAVDSAHAAYSLLMNGALPTLEKIDGAYVLIWFDSRTKTLNMARNTERELFYAMDAAKTRLYFASEVEWLSSILRRNDIPHEDKFYELDIHTLYSYDLTKKTLVPKKTKYEEKKYLPVATYGNYHGASAGHSNAVSDWKKGKKDYVKICPANGDYIWVKVASTEDLQLYQTIGDAPNQVTEKNAYGYIWGTRSMDNGSVVKITGINFVEWRDKLHLIRSSMPCKITNVKRNCSLDDGSGRVYTAYECILDDEEVKIELQRISKMAEEAEHRRSLQSSSESDQCGVGCGSESSTRGSEDVGPYNGSYPGAGGGSSSTVHINPTVTVLTPNKVPGPRGSKITLHDWQMIAAENCIICDGVLDESDIGLVEWWEFPRNHEDRNPQDAEYQMICPACKDDPKAIAKLVA